MNILQLSDRTHDYVQGFDLAEEIARALIADRHTFIFGVLTGEADANLSERIGCATKIFRLSRRAMKPTSLATVLMLARFIRAHKIDVVITHRFKPWLLMAVVRLLVPKLRCVGVFHAFKQFDRKRRQLLAQILLTRRWLVVAVSDAVRRDLIEHSIPSSRIAVIRNAIDIDGVRAALFTREQARAELKLPSGVTVIGTLGRTKPIKGHRYLIDAFAQLAAQNRDIHLLIIGGGEGEAELREQIAQRGLAGRATITGPISNAARLLRAIDIFAFPSLNEGLGLAALEAVAARLPVIATNAGGIPEALGSNGIFVAPGNSAQLAAALQGALTWSETERIRYIDLLEQHLLAEFNIAHYHQRFQDLVARLTVAG